MKNSLIIFYLESLSTFAHSQGTTVTITYLATLPNHALEKVNMAIVASPSVYVGSFFKNAAGKWIYKGVLYTVIKLLNMLIIKLVIHLTTLTLICKKFLVQKIF